MNILLDTNVLLDVIAKREPFSVASVEIWNLVESRSVAGYISAISFNNIYYITRKYGNEDKARQAIKILLDTFQVVSLDEMVIRKAIFCGMKDFEDAIQLFSAAHINADYIITRNVKDFQNDDIIALTPEDYLNL